MTKPTNVFDEAPRPCRDCREMVDPIDFFPGQRCMRCHTAIIDKLPLQRPDFLAAIGARRVKRSGR